MAVLLHLAAVCWLLLSSAVYSLAKPPDESVVTTSFGVVRGERVPLEEFGLKRPVVQFLGVPYGVAPVGRSRFRFPQTAAKWTNVPKEATRQPSVCSQRLPPSKTKDGQLPPVRDEQLRRQRLKLDSRQSEDCLYMNVYVPARLDKDGRADERRAVLVVIHGDDWDWGAGSAHNASVLASHGNILVVTVNYRIGAMGFLAWCDASNTCNGNWGLGDIISALTFVRKLLPALGGDGGRVTLLGWGSGAAAVNLLMSSPMTSPGGTDAFQRAILLDGSSLSSWAIVENPNPYFYYLAKNASCPTVEHTRGMPRRLPNENIVDCIRNQSIERITKALHNMAAEPTFLSAFGPVVDGQVVPNYPEQNLAQYGDLFRQIDLMVGLTQNSAYHWLKSADVREGISVARRDTIYRTLVRNLFSYHRREILDAIVNEYTDWQRPNAQPEVQTRLVLQALSDVLYAAPAMRTAQLHAAGKRRDSKHTYAFVFAHRSAAWDRGELDGSLSAEHVPYVLGYPLWTGDATADIPYERFGTSDRAASLLMMDIVSDFVRNGKPSDPVRVGDGLAGEKASDEIFWDEFSEATREAYLHIGETTQVNHYYRADKLAFWNGYLPRLQDAGRDEKVPDTHHQLNDHYGDSYFGHVRPQNDGGAFPFPPPPLPPPPPTADVAQATPKPSEQPATPQVANATKGEYTTILSVTVAVGSALLVLNILIFAGIYHQRDKQRKAKHSQLHYRSYDSPSNPLSPATGTSYDIQSPVAAASVAVPPPPPPPRPAIHPAAVVDGEANQHVSMRTFNSHHHHGGGGGGGGASAGGGARAFAEHEPLLSGSATRVLPPGVSPTCPRHGRAALLAMQQNQQASVEEIQV